MAKRPVAISRMWLLCFINYFKMTVRIMSGKEDLYVRAADKLLVSLAISYWYYSECAKEHFWFIAGPMYLILKCVPHIAPVREYTKILLQPSPLSLLLRNRSVLNSPISQKQLHCWPSPETPNRDLRGLLWHQAQDAQVTILSPTLWWQWETSHSTILFNDNSK